MITLYHRSDCPFCWKVRIALAELGLDYQLIDTRLDEKHHDVERLNPKGSVPVFIDASTGGGDCVIWESNAILEYLDEAYGPGKLFPGTAKQRAQQRLLVSYSDTVIGPALRAQIFEKRSKPPAEWNQDLIAQSDQAWRACMQQLETWLEGKGFFTGEFSAAECALLPRFGIAQQYGAAGLEDFPQLTRWFARGKERASYQTSFPSAFIECANS